MSAATSDTRLFYIHGAETDKDRSPNLPVEGGTRRSVLFAESSRQYTDVRYGVENRTLAAVFCLLQCATSLAAALCTL